VQVLVGVSAKVPVKPKGVQAVRNAVVKSNPVNGYFGVGLAVKPRLQGCGLHAGQATYLHNLLAINKVWANFV